MATAVKYIDSNSKRFYSSEFVPVRPDGRIELPLPAKMRKKSTAPNWNRHSDNQGKSTRKKKKPPFEPVHKVRVMTDAYVGHTIMMTQDQVLDSYGYTLGFD